MCEIGNCRDWNVRGQNQPGKLANIWREMTIMSLRETFWRGQDDIVTSLLSYQCRWMSTYERGMKEHKHQQQEYQKLNKMVKNKCRLVKSEWLNDKCKKIGSLDKVNKQNEMYQKIRAFN